LTASRTLSKNLQEEHNRNEAMLTQLRELVGVTQQEANNLSFLMNGSAAQSLKVTDNPDQQSLTTNTKFAVSQLPALRSLLAELRPKLAALKASDKDASLNSAKEEIKEERRGYIEQRTWSRLERNGMEPAENFNLLSGRRVDAEEVQALEKVASVFDQA
jgi:kinetochore protein Mis12/MTW1